jgi:hypothetical protein
MAPFPFKNPTTAEIEYFGGIETTIRTWSGWILRSIVSSFFHWHSYSMTSAIDLPTLSGKTWNRRFGYCTIWCFNSHTAGSNLLNVLIEYLHIIFRITHPCFKEVSLFLKPLTYPLSKARTTRLAGGLRHKSRCNSRSRNENFLINAEHRRALFFYTEQCSTSRWD